MYKLTINPRRKRLGLEIDPNGQLIVKAPPGVSQQQIKSALEHHANWIKKHQTKVKAAKPKQNYNHGSMHWLWGEPYPLHIEQGKFTRIRKTDDYWHLQIDKDYYPELGREMLINWMKSAALDIFPKQLRDKYQQIKHLGLKPLQKISIRMMKSRWGSCSSAGNISLNLGLIQLPTTCLDYIIAHELCHLKEMNHSPRFYALMDEVMPDWSIARQRLKALAKTVPLLQTMPA